MLQTIKQKTDQLFTVINTEPVINALFVTFLFFTVIFMVRWLSP